MAVIGMYTNSKGDSIEFSKESGIRITSWDGLTSNSADIDETTTINQIGSTVTGVGIKSKPQTIEGRYRYDKDKRYQLLAIILPGDKGRLRYINTIEGLDVCWDVTVKESPEISNGVEYQNFQFVVQCGYPYPRDTDNQFLEFSPTVSNFSFPRSYSSTVSWKISSKQFQPLRQIRNLGTIETGFKITMTADDNDIKGPYVINVDTQEEIKLTNLELVLGDKLVIGTYANDSYCRLYRDGEEINVFEYTTFESVFFSLNVGINNIRYGAITNESNLDARIEYDTIRAGV